MALAVHTISFRGLAGLLFCLHMGAWFFYVLAYATPYWSKEWDNRNAYFGAEGVWETGSLSHTTGGNRDWYKAFQAMTTIGLILLFLSIILVFLYMCIHQVSKNFTIIALVILGFVSFGFMIIGIIIYAAESPRRLGWSFGMAIIGAAFTLAGAIVSLLQLRASGVNS